MAQAVQCDQCTTHAKLVDTPAGPHIPPGWLLVHRVASGMWHFCCWQCACQFAALAHSVGEPTGGA